MPLLEVRVLAFTSLLENMALRVKSDFLEIVLWKKSPFVHLYFFFLYSKLSTYNDFCAALADCSRCYILFLALLNKYQKQQVSFSSLDFYILIL